MVVSSIDGDTKNDFMIVLYIITFNGFLLKVLLVKFFYFSYISIQIESFVYTKAYGVNLQRVI